MAFTQANRLLQFASPAGPDVLLIQSLEGVEGISRLFEFQAEVFADASTEIDLSSLIGNKATVAIELLDVEGTRYLNGVIASFEQQGGDAELNWYNVHLVPSLWLSTLSVNCRVFQDKTPMDIIKAVLSAYPLSLSDQTQGSYAPLDYCTQYNETDFHFISRIAEQFGIFYWFTHTNGDNKVCFGDSRDAYAECPSYSQVQYSPQGSKGEDMYHSVCSEIRATASMVTNKHTAWDYDYLSFKSYQGDSQTSDANAGANAFENYTYPSGEAAFIKDISGAVTGANTTTIVTARRDASDVAYNMYHGISTSRTFLPGCTFSLTKHLRDAWNQTYVLTEVVHHVEQTPPYRSEEAASANPYTNRFVAIESTRLFRPEARTPKPRITGPQTGIVIGSSGEEIQVDAKGRVNVQFFWDRLRESDTVDNTWVRVGQPWAGNGRGTFYWPRVHDEVLISFIDGDPDAPIVVGSLYNGVNMPKYALPDNSTRTGIVTRSSKGGSAADANELRFEDKKGSEQIYIHATMDMDQRVKNDSRRWVGGADSLVVMGDQMDLINGDQHTEKKKKKIEKIGDKYDLAIAADFNNKVGGNLSMDVSSNIAEKAGMNWSMDAGMEAYVKGGMTVTIEAGMDLTLKGPGGFISIGPAGVIISGTMVLINSGGAAGSGTAGQLTAPGDPNPPAVADDGSKGGAM